MASFTRRPSRSVGSGKASYSPPESKESSPNYLSSTPPSSIASERRGTMRSSDALLRQARTNRSLLSTYPAISRTRSASVALTGTRPNSLSSMLLEESGGRALGYSGASTGLGPSSTSLRNTASALDIDSLEDDLEGEIEVAEEMARFDERVDHALRTGISATRRRNSLDQYEGTVATDMDDCPKCKRLLDFATKAQLDCKTAKEEMERNQKTWDEEKRKLQDKQRNKTLALQEELQRQGKLLDEELSQFKKRVRDMQLDYETQMASQASRLRADAEENQRGLEREIIDLKTKLASSDKRAIDLEQTISVMSREKDKLTQETREERERLLMKHKEELDKSQNDLRRVHQLLDKQQTEHEAKLEDLRTQHSLALKNAAQRLEEEKQNALAESEMRRALDDSEAKVRRLEHDLSLMSQTSTLELDKERKSRFTLETKLHETREVMTRLQDELNMEKSILNEEKSRTNALRSNLEKSTQEVTKLREETARWQKACESLQVVKETRPGKRTSIIPSLLRLLFVLATLLSAFVIISLLIFVKSPGRLHYSPLHELGLIYRDLLVDWLDLQRSPFLQPS